MTKRKRFERIHHLLLAASLQVRTLFDKHPIFFIVFLSTFVIAWQWPLLFTSNKIVSGDFDYFTQAYEAVRSSIVNYHQFPWTNAWVGGGVPLYANPQVGVFSLQTILVIIFGAAYGLKLSLVIYSLIGFWGAFYLLKNSFSTPIRLAAPLSLIWVTNGFFAAHLVGHYTFALFAVFPLLLYLLLNIRRRFFALYLGIALALLVLSAFHYAAFQSLLILGFVALGQLYTNRRIFSTYLKLYLKTIAVFILCAGHRMLYAIDYVFDFPRAFSDLPNQLGGTLKSFIIPNDPSFWFYDIVKLPKLIYSWPEYTAFIGYLIIAGVFLICAYHVNHLLIQRNRVSLRQKVVDKSSVKALGIFSIAIFFVIMSLGPFSGLSPYSVLTQLPIFSGMRVPSRWLIWSILALILFIGYSHRLIRNRTIQNIVTILVILGAVEVALAGFANDRFYDKPAVFRNSPAVFEQFEDFDSKNLPYNFQDYEKRSSLDRRTELYGYDSTLNNLGEVKGYEPIMDTRFGHTLRCGIVQGCGLVVSKNAHVTYWSPNKIILSRTAPGDIEVNMNPSNYWIINGERTFASAKVAETNLRFIIKDEATIITLTSKPRNPFAFTQSTIHKVIY